MNVIVPCSAVGEYATSGSPGNPPQPATTTIGSATAVASATSWTSANNAGVSQSNGLPVVALVSVALILVLVAFRDELARIYNAMRSELNTQIGSINQAST